MWSVTEGHKAQLSVEFYSLPGVLSVADLVRVGRLRWFGHLEHVDDWVSICTNVMVVGWWR